MIASHDITAFIDGVQAIAVAGEPLQRHPLVFPGSFNPLHRGHRGMAQVAAQRFDRPVHFEISLTNVDKDSLAADDLAQRTDQFVPASSEEPFPFAFGVVLTRAPRFRQKVELFETPIFIVGYDTLARMVDAKYYDGDRARMERQVGELSERVQHFLVFGRLVEGRYRSLHDLDMPRSLRERCINVTESEFRRDVSSTELRG